jgi:hypothetical protein
MKLGVFKLKLAVSCNNITPPASDDAIQILIHEGETCGDDMAGRGPSTCGEANDAGTSRTLDTTRLVSVKLSVGLLFFSLPRQSSNPGPPPNGLGLDFRFQVLGFRL